MSSDKKAQREYKTYLLGLVVELASDLVLKSNLDNGQSSKNAFTHYNVPLTQNINFRLLMEVG